MRWEKDRARRRTKGKKRSSETEDHEKQCLATLKRLKRGDEERKLRLENMQCCHNVEFYPNSLDFLPLNFLFRFYQ